MAKNLRIFKELIKTTEDHKRYWKDRKINWDDAYLKTWDHPHRFLISDVLSRLNWISLMELGCGAGANIKNILSRLRGKQVGGVDINPEAIELCDKTFKGGVFKVGSSDDVMMSDSSTDVVLSDMALIYVGPRKIDRYIREIKRIGRKYVVLCEFHSNSLWNRIALKMNSGYNAYNYEKLLQKHGFYDIMIRKIKEEEWPGGNPQKTFGYIIVAKIPKIK